MVVAGRGPKRNLAARLQSQRGQIQAVFRPFDDRPPTARRPRRVRIACAPAAGTGSRRRPAKSRRGLSRCLAGRQPGWPHHEAPARSPGRFWRTARSSLADMRTGTTRLRSDVQIGRRLLDGDLGRRVGHGVDRPAIVGAAADAVAIRQIDAVEARLLDPPPRGSNVETAAVGADFRRESPPRLRRRSSPSRAAWSPRRRVRCPCPRARGDAVRPPPADGRCSSAGTGGRRAIRRPAARSTAARRPRPRRLVRTDWPSRAKRDSGPAPAPRRAETPASSKPAASAATAQAAGRRSSTAANSTFRVSAVTRAISSRRSASRAGRRVVVRLAEKLDCAEEPVAQGGKTPLDAPGQFAVAQPGRRDRADHVEQTPPRPPPTPPATQTAEGRDPEIAANNRPRRSPTTAPSQATAATLSAWTAASRRTRRRNATIFCVSG